MRSLIAFLCNTNNGPPDKTLTGEINALTHKVQRTPMKGIIVAAGTWTLVQGARQDILTGAILSGSSFKVALFTSASNISTTSTTYAGLTNEVANANGYTTGGIAVTLALVGTTSVAVSFSSNPVWTASGGSITARFAVLYKVSGDVLCFVLLDSTPADVVATAGNTLTLDSDGSPSPVLTLA